MKLVLGLAIGYLVGSRAAGSPALERVEQTVRDVGSSEEFRRFVTAVKDLASRATAGEAGSGDRA